MRSDCVDFFIPLNSFVLRDSFLNKWRLLIMIDLSIFCFPIKKPPDYCELILKLK